VREARALADGRVARCLYQRAVGHEHKVERTLWHLGKERPVNDTLYYPPDVRACIFWLRNRPAAALGEAAPRRLRRIRTS
jgi:hypothetical protein